MSCAARSQVRRRGRPAPVNSLSLSLNPAIVKQWGDIEDSSIGSMFQYQNVIKEIPGRNSESQVVKLTWCWRSQYLLDWTNSNYSLIIHSRTKRQAVNSQKFRVSIKVKHNRVSQFPFSQWPSCEDWWDQVYLVFHLNCKMSIKPFQNLFRRVASCISWDYFSQKGNCFPFPHSFSSR